MTQEPETINIKPDRSAPLRFRGWRIAEMEWQTKRGDTMRFELWRSVGGAIIATREGFDDDGHGYLDAAVIEPTEPWEDKPPFAMVDQVMGFYRWEDRARSMVKRQAKWDFLRRVA